MAGLGRSVRSQDHVLGILASPLVSVECGVCTTAHSGRRSRLTSDPAPPMFEQPQHNALDSPLGARRTDRAAFSVQ